MTMTHRTEMVLVHLTQWQGYGKQKIYERYESKVSVLL